MQNIILMKRTPELEKLSQELGFKKSVFLDDMTVIKANTNGVLIKALQKAKGLTIFKPSTEELLRFALEKTRVDLVYGFEKVNPKDSVHYVRGGLDQITCKIAVSRSKQIGFSFSEILNSKNPGKLLGRMRANLKLCSKYGVDVVISSFSTSKEELRSAQDLKMFFVCLQKKKKSL